MKFAFDFDDTHFGSFDSDTNEIIISLGCFKNSAMCNNGYGSGEILKRIGSKRTSIDQIIKDITYTIGHEYIHSTTHKSAKHNGLEAEYMAYYLVGNGGNGFFHEFYPIKEKKSWTRYI